MKVQTPDGTPVVREVIPDDGLVSEASCSSLITSMPIFSFMLAIMLTMLALPVRSP